MSRARVALDALLELGGGDRKGQAAVLAEILMHDPELLQLAAIGPVGDLVRSTTRVARPWLDFADSSVRFDLFREHWVGRVEPYTQDNGEPAWRTWCRRGGEPLFLSRCVSLEEAKGVVDRALRGSVSEGWILQEDT